MPTKEKKVERFSRLLPWILTIGGAIGLISSFILTIDEMKILKNPGFQPACNINPIIACGSVMTSGQAHIFGIPNPVIGIAAFAVLTTVGVCLIASAKFKRWFWLTLSSVAFLGTIFVHWLFFETLFRINSLCPYCMVVWIITISTFWYSLLFNLSQGYLKVPTRCEKVALFAQRHHLDILILWFIILAIIILKHFWYYYGHYL